jgi:bacillithiol system protein YtxJ
MSETTIRDLESFDRALHQPRVLLFKHSPACSLSAVAHEHYEAFCRDLPDVPTMLVDVVADRDVARAIADHCGIRHESPQATLFEQGQPVWHASHRAITLDSLHAAWSPRC